MEVCSMTQSEEALHFVQDLYDAGGSPSADTKKTHLKVPMASHRRSLKENCQSFSQRPLLISSYIPLPFFSSSPGVGESSEEDLSPSPLSSIEYLNFSHEPSAIPRESFVLPGGRAGSGGSPPLRNDSPKNQFPCFPRVVVSDYSSKEDGARPEKDAEPLPPRLASPPPPPVSEDAACSAEILTRSPQKVSTWNKLKAVVHCAPLFQTYKKCKYPWVQLAGHQGGFKAGKERGTILKKFNLREALCFEKLMSDPLKSFIPEYRGKVLGENGEYYIQIEDLLATFDSPCVMDCKMGTRTYLEEELEKAKEKPKFRKLIGTSLLFVHDHNQANVWLIDFAKTIPTPKDTQITHCTLWKQGNHEDGYLIGLDHLILIMESLADGL